jgi:hypothetical protein
MSALEQFVTFVRSHPDEMTRADITQLEALAQEVYLEAVEKGCLLSIPQVAELRTQLESQLPPLPPVQFETKLNLPGDWAWPQDDGIPRPTSYPLIRDGQVVLEEPRAPAEAVFLPSPSPRWFADIEVLRKLLTEQVQQFEEYVTLDQMAAAVNRTKRALEKYKDRRLHPQDFLPDADIQGGGGKPDEWKWSTARPWLEKVFGKRLPEKFFATRPPTR